MKKRIFSALLCIAMLLTLLPAAASAAGDIRMMTISADFDLTAGAKIPFDSDLLTEDAPELYTAYFWDYSWGCSDGLCMPGMNFSGGETYTMTVLIVPKNGVGGLNEQTAPSLPVYINGQRAKFNPACSPELEQEPGRTVYAYQIKVQCPWSDVITLIDVNGITLPATGAVASVDGLSPREDAPYEITYAFWKYYDEDGNSYGVSAGGVFKNNVSYSVEIRLQAKEGYTFAPTEDCTFLINGSPNMLDIEYSFTDGELAVLCCSEYKAEKRHVDTVNIENMGLFYAGSTAWSAVKDVTVPISAGYSLFFLDDCTVSEVVSNTYINDDDCFEAGKTYRATFCIRPDAGWYIDKNTVWSINGSQDLVFYAAENYDGNYWFVMTEPTPAVDPLSLDTAYIYGVTVPVVGMKASDCVNVFVLGDLYEVTEAYWLCDTNGFVMDPNGVFEAGKEYSLCVCLAPCDPAIAFTYETQYVFNSDIETDFGGVEEDGTGFAWTVTITPKSDTVIDEVVLINYELPRCGEMPVTTEELCVPEDAPYEIVSVDWYLADTAYSAESFTGAFKEGKTYFAIIWVTPKEGYTFADTLALTVDGEDASTWTVTLDSSGDLEIDTPDQTVYAPVTAVNAQIPVPVPGQKPATREDVILTSTPADASLTVGDLIWSIYDPENPESDWTTIEDPDYTFVEGEIYDVDIYIYTGDTYCVDPSVAGTVNGIPSDTEYGDVYSAPNEIYLSAAWTAIGDPCAGYTDINRSAWYHGAVDFVLYHGLMGSTKTDKLTFEPNTKVTRAMVTSILYAMAGKPAVEYKSTFTDVAKTAWYSNAVEWCAQNGLASGKGAGKFDPNGYVTRQELAVFMMKMAENRGSDTSGRADLSGFADAMKVPTWAKTYVQWAVSANLLSGKASGSKLYLAPTDTASRAELAAIIGSFVMNFMIS